MGAAAGGRARGATTQVLELKLLSLFLWFENKSESGAWEMAYSGEPGHARAVPGTAHCTGHRAHSAVLARRKRSAWGLFENKMFGYLEFL